MSQERLFYPYIIATTPVGVFRGAVTPLPLTTEAAEGELRRMQDRHARGECLELFCGHTRSKLQLSQAVAKVAVLAFSLLPARPRLA